jgi:hypothetical protein
MQPQIPRAAPADSSSSSSGGGGSGGVMPDAAAPLPTSLQPAAAGAGAPLSPPPPAAPRPPPDTGPRDKSDLVKAVAVGAVVSVVAGILDHQAVEEHQGLAMAAVFCLGCAKGAAGSVAAISARIVL